MEWSCNVDLCNGLPTALRQVKIKAFKLHRSPETVTFPMPIYEYTCEGCQHDFELLIRGDERPVCPDCGGKKLEKRFSIPAAHIQGGSSLPLCAPRPRGGGCGLPQCGTGGCMGM